MVCGLRGGEISLEFLHSPLYTPDEKAVDEALWERLSVA